MNWNGQSNSINSNNNWNKFSTGLSNQKKDKIEILEEKVNNLEKQINSLSNSNNYRKRMHVIHTNIVCNNCMKNNISGIRYLCGNCNNYNLCQDCIKYAEEIHPTNHFFIRITDSNIWNQINNKNYNV